VTQDIRLHKARLAPLITMAQV